MYEGREIFANAPLVWVSAEIQINYEPDVVPQASRDNFAQAVREVLPMLSVQSIQSEALTGPDGGEVFETLPAMRAISLNRKTGASLSPRTLTLETLEYSTYDSFAETLELVVSAFLETAPRARVRRVGLRYLDEVRVPGIEASRDWRGWIADHYLAPIHALPNIDVAAYTGSMVTRISDESRLWFRWGEIFGSTVLNPDIDMDVPSPEKSRFFILDSDSAWESDEAPAMDTAAIMSLFSELHAPVGSMFMSALTEQVKGIFRGASDE